MEEHRKFIELELSEREQLLKEEVKKAELRKTATAMQAGMAKVASSGQLSASEGMTSKPHRNYGGRLLTEFGGRKAKNSFSRAWLQKREIEAKYSFLKGRIVDDSLVCTGTIQPEGCSSYKIRLEYRSGAAPQVYIVEPQIVPHSDIHMYAEGSLCLYYPGDMRWTDRTSIAEYTIPWVVEWILCYELYQLTGKWEAEFVPHGIIGTCLE